MPTITRQQTARQHAEWISLIETSGPFLSVTVLLDVLPQGLVSHDPELMRSLRQAYDEWSDDRHDPEIHRLWIEWVMRELMGLPDAVVRSGQALPEGLTVRSSLGTTLRPDYAIARAGEMPVLFVQRVAPEVSLDHKSPGALIAPTDALLELLRGTGVRLGLLTNGERWMLVHAPGTGEAVGYASWYANLWIEEKVTLRAWRSLLDARALLGREADRLLLTWLDRSRDDKQEVTDQLGFQVRKAVEVLVQTIDRVNRDRGGELLAGVDDGTLYRAALTVMMRLVFLFAAEEQGLLSLGDRIYDENYAVSTLRAQLRELADKFGEELLERYVDAWGRLLATFRMIHHGSDHDALRVRGYGGDLFDPDRFPFLEGRAAGSRWDNPALRGVAFPAIDNRTVLHLLEALQVLQVAVPGGGMEPRVMSFRSLDVEQIGHVYEGLLERRVVRAREWTLGLVGAKHGEAELTLSELEGLGEDSAQQVKFLQQVTGRSAAALKKALALGAVEPDFKDREMDRLLGLCGNDRALFDRVWRFAGLLRRDSFDRPVVIAPGSVFVTVGTQRRESGAHYTPRELTEEIVLHALEPIVYVGVASGLPRSEWRLKSARELLALKVCDIAMGSGAFLVQVCRFLADRLVEAWSIEAAGMSGRGRAVRVLPDGSLSRAKPEEAVLSADVVERSIEARRLVAERCLYGVDINPLAVEMAKLSLWLVTLSKDKPFTFLDHALKCGDSLVGVSLEQLCYWSLDVSGTPELFADDIRRSVSGSLAMRRELADLPIGVSSQKRELLARASARVNDLRSGCDLLVSSYFAEVAKKANRDGVRSELLLAFRDGADVSEGLRSLLPDLDRFARFHWELEFPEVFVGGGFDAIVGNPPFMGGKKITGNISTAFRDYLVDWVADSVKGCSDLCAYFFLRTRSLLKQGGTFGLVATNTISQGDTREVGLDQLAKLNTIFYRAVPSRPWPGTAALEVAYVWGFVGKWVNEFVLNGQAVKGITPFLTVPGKTVGNPKKLAKNVNKSFQGSVVLGMGFVLEPEEAQALVEKDSKNKDVLLPYLNGQDLNTNPDQSPSRWVINFFDWPLDAEHDDPKKLKGKPYAVDYPDCFKIVEEKVKPERAKSNRKVYRERWWQYAEKQKTLYESIAERDRVLVAARVSKMLIFSFVPKDQVYSEMIVVLNLEEYQYFSLMQSSLHSNWAWQNCSTMRDAGIRYSPTDGFETFPFPEPTNPQPLEQIGQTYYQHRQKIMTETQLGLTKTYNRFHDPDETHPDIQTLRHLHRQMDETVAAAYGWDDLPLNHDFHDTKQGIRYTIDEPARRELLDRLLQLNFDRYAQEEKQGLHQKKKTKPQKQTTKTNDKQTGQLNLLQEP